MAKVNSNMPSETARSSKLHLIDRATFDRYNQHESSDFNKSIRNSKYRKTKMEFNLMNFLKPRKVCYKKYLYANCCSHKSLQRSVRKAVPKGKTREGFRKRRHTKLKKIIRKHRLLKKNLNINAKNELPEAEIVIATQKIENLNITKTEYKTIFSRRFREYCENATSTKLKELTKTLLRDLDRFQKRSFAQNEFKARAHRRFVIGMREVLSLLPISKLKLIIIAPDCESCNEPDGLDEKISNIKTECLQNNIPYLFSLKRRELGYVLHKKVPLTCVGIIDYDGAQNTFKELLDCLKEERKTFQATKKTDFIKNKI